MATSPLTLLIQVIDQASPLIKSTIEGVKGLGSAVTSVAFAYNETQQAISSLAAQGQRAYQLLVGQNVQLQQQLLATQSSLAATNKVISQGMEIKDPTAAIKALGEPVKQAIADLRKGSLELVGVTSNDLVPLFQIVAQNSSNIGASLQQSSSLALSFAAALGTLNIPLDQARQEIDSIVTGQISSDSQLAKSLNITNQQVNQYKAQGVLVEKLTEKLSAFRAGNQLAANTIEGVSSNIQEIFDEIGRVAGEPLLQPIVAQLNLVYEFLKQNKDQIQEIASQVVDFFLGIGNKLGEVVNAIAPVLSQSFAALFVQSSSEAAAFGAVLSLIVDGFVALVIASKPLLQILADISTVFAQFASSDIEGLVLQATILVGLFAQFAPLLVATGVGFTNAAAAAFLFSTAASGSASAQVALATLSPTLAAIAASYAAAGGGALGFAAAMGTATASASAFGMAAAAAMAPLLPLIALGGAITVALIVKQTGDLKHVNEELEEFRQQNDLLSDESLRVASRLKALNDVEKANGQLNEEQAKKRAGYQRIAAEQVKVLQEQKAAVEALKPASEEQRRTQETQLNQLQRSIDLLNKQSGGVKLQAKDLADLGNTYQQLGKKVADAEAQIKSGGGGDSERFKGAAQELVELTEKQLELGQITSLQAQERLSRVANDSRVEYETQLQAVEAITKVRQVEVDKRVGAAENEQSRIQALISRGVISDAEGQRQITDSKKQQLQLQIQAVQQAIATENALRQSQVNKQIEEINKQLAEAKDRAAEANTKGDKGNARLAGEDIKRLEQQKATAQSSLQINSQRQTELKSQQQKLQTELAQIEGEARQRQQAERLKDFDEQQQILDSANSRKLISESQFAVKSLEIARSKGAAELAQIKEQRTQLNPNDKEGQEAIVAKEAAVRQKLAEATEKFEQQKSQIQINAVEDRQRILDGEKEASLISEVEFNQRSLELIREKTEAEIQEIERQRTRTPKSDMSGRLALDAKEAEARKAIAVKTEEFEQQKSRIQISAIEDRQRILDGEKEASLISEAEFNQRSLQLTKEKAEDEIQEVQRQRVRIPKSDTNGRLALDAKEAEARKAIAIKEEEFEQVKSRARIAVIDNEQRILESSLSSGLITEQQYNEQSLAITQSRLQAELDEVNRQRSELKVVDAQKLGELAAQEADIRKKQLDALAVYQQQQIALIEDGQKQATEAIAQAEADRLTQITQLEAKGTISKAEAEQRRVNLTADRVRQELQLEKDKLAQLEALPSFADPRKEDERQSQIRATRLKTSQLTKSLIDNEVAQQQALTRVIEEGLNRQIKATENAATAQTQALNKEELIGKEIVRSLNNQVKLLEARKNLVSSLSGFYQGELEILKETAKTEQEKKELAESAAEIRLRAVQEQAKIEREILLLNIQQKQAALEQEKLQLRIQQIQARAATLTNQAEQKKVEASKDTTPEEKEAARLKVEASVATELGLQQKGAILDEQGQLNKQDAQLELQSLNRKNFVEIDKARLDLANSRVDTKLGEQEKEALRKEILDDLTLKGTASLKNLGKEAILDYLPVSQITLPQTQFIKPATQLQIPQNNASVLPELSAIKAIASKQTQGNVTINIANNFTKETPRQVADTTTQSIRKELYDLGMLLTK